MNIRTKTSIDADVDIFIIPNHLCLASDFIPSEVERKLQVIAEFNLGNNLGITNPDKEPLVQLWWSSKDLNSENLCDHGGYYIDANNQRVYVPTTFLTYAPVSLFRTAKEGDVIPIEICHETSSTDCITDTICYHFKARCAHLDYRYRNMGKFEEVLARLMSQAGYGFDKED